MKPLFAAILLSFLILSPLVAQKRASKPAAQALASHQLLSLKVTGTSRYTDQEILAASGLQIGQEAADADFKEAAQRLGESGLFSDVVYSFTYSDAGIKLEFQLTDNPSIKLVPAYFENFVWFSDADLFSALRQRVPLFKELLPVSGQLPDRVSDALQALLLDRHFPGRVDYLREGKQDGGDIISVSYRVEDVSIRIRSVDFPGATPGQAAFLARAAHSLLDGDYYRSKCAAVARYELLPQYLARGYLKAVFASSEARILPAALGTESKAGETATESEALSEIVVDALIPVTPGNVYSVSGLSWKGNSAISTEEASRLLHLAKDRPADAVQLLADVENLVKLYHSRGYMTAQIKPDAELNDENNTVRYAIEISEGDVYRMGELEILGVDSGSRDRLREAWTLREGQPYNADYTKKFLENAPRLLPKGAQFSVNVSEELDRKEKLVDVTIRFKMS